MTRNDGAPVTVAEAPEEFPCPGADKTGRNEFLHISASSRPPEPPVQQGERVANSRVTGQAGGVSPFKDPRVSFFWNIQTVSGGLGGSDLTLQSPLHLVLNLKPGSGDQHVGRKDGVRDLQTLRRGVEA